MINRLAPILGALMVYALAIGGLLAAYAGVKRSEKLLKILNIMRKIYSKILLIKIHKIILKIQF